jgi:hypothetical protein
MLRRVALGRTDVSKERSGSIIRVTRISELGRALAVSSNRRMLRRLLVTANALPSSPILVNLMMEALPSSETSVLTGVRRRNIPEDGILHSHRSENLKSYILYSSSRPKVVTNIIFHAVSETSDVNLCNQIPFFQNYMPNSIVILTN